MNTTTTARVAHPVLSENDVVTFAAARKALAALRISFGLIFLWAFFDKLLALGFSTGAVTDEAGAKTGVDYFGDAAWINGGSPTEGFLKFNNGTFHSFFNAIPPAFADWLFMAGLLGIGLALTFGAGIRLAGIAGALMYALMWLASFPLAHHPFIDDHFTGMIVVVVLALTLSGDTWGLGRWWANRGIVAKFPILR